MNKKHITTYSLTPLLLAVSIQSALAQEAGNSLPLEECPWILN